MGAWASLRRLSLYFQVLPLPRRALPDRSPGCSANRPSPLSRPSPLNRLLIPTIDWQYLDKLLHQRLQLLLRQTLLIAAFEVAAEEKRSLDLDARTLVAQGGQDVVKNSLQSGLK